MEYLDTPISIIYWKNQYGEPLTVEEAEQLEAWQRAHPGKAPHVVLHNELTFHEAFKQGRQAAMQRLLATIDPATVPAETETPVVPMPTTRWYQQRRIVVAAVIAGSVGIGVALWMPDHKTAESGQTQQVAHTVQRPAASDTALFVELADGERFAVGTKDTGVLAQLGSVQLRSTGSRQLVYEAVAGEKGEALIHHKIVTIGQQLVTVELVDHSVAELGPHSLLQVDVSGSSEKRIVHLAGIAHFTVAHDKNRPFIVNTAGATLQVLGTEFVVTTKDKDFTTVGLVNGSLLVSGARQRATLVPGQTVQVSPSGDVRYVKDRLNSLLGFTENRFYYSNKTLATITADIEQWYAVQLIDSNPSDSLGTYHFGPVPRDLPLTKVLEKLNKLTGHQFRYEQRP
ncbi:FecR family protein [Paraflavitalea pollutisoli]|uniref:FecR family protein n=1 Tax=Paraflavitalea pollutisoli TaxID=3034143 RepID=UPI0023EE11AD|nr:FecR family protein [Paraflavitalea sp. H1-2-19X]